MKVPKLSELEYVIFDLETTGLYAEQGDEIIEFGAIRLKGLEITTESFQSLVKPPRTIPEAASAVHGITDKDVSKSPPVSEILPKFYEFCGNSYWVAQNARFDLSFILRDMKRLGINFRQSFAIDTIGISKILFPFESRHNLDVMMARLGISKIGDRHRSLDDCRFTALVLIEFIKLLENQGITELKDIESAFIKSDSIAKKLKPKTMGLFG